MLNGSPLNTLRSNATLDFEGAEVNRPFYGSDRNNVAPRAGFAWAMDREARNVLRGGYGHAYDGAPLSIAAAVFGEPYLSRRALVAVPGLPPLCCEQCLMPVVPRLYATVAPAFASYLTKRHAGSNHDPAATWVVGPGHLMQPQGPGGHGDQG